MHIKSGHCHNCKKITEFHNRECSECKEKDRKESLAEWMEKSSDERLLDLHERLLDVEKRTIQFRTFR